mmetsp:Transcript_12310/g.31235  ORF Transcript_12310/g.31235 Transcript_12310/m.31235 type:complete len:235 (-) Transcript_12310:137-841(-)
MLLLRSSFPRLASFSVLLLLLLLSAESDAHATQYPGLAGLGANCTGIPKILSYHVHIVYDLYSENQVNAALAFREQTRKDWADVLTPDCDGRYDYGRVCLIYDHPLNTTLLNGPFPSGEWSMFTPLPFVERAVQYFTLNRPLSLSFLLHPNTGCEYMDHSTSALWAGMAWPLNFDIFKNGVQTNEYGQKQGNKGNIVCLAEGTRCGPANDQNLSSKCCAPLSCSACSDGVCTCA